MDGGDYPCPYCQAIIQNGLVEYHFQYECEAISTTSSHNYVDNSHYRQPYNNYFGSKPRLPGMLNYRQTNDRDFYHFLQDDERDMLNPVYDLSNKYANIKPSTRDPSTQNHSKELRTVLQKFPDNKTKIYREPEPEKEVTLYPCGICHKELIEELYESHLEKCLEMVKKKISNSRAHEEEKEFDLKIKNFKENSKCPICFFYIEDKNLENHFTTDCPSFECKNCKMRILLTEEYHEETCIPIEKEESIILSGLSKYLKSVIENSIIKRTGRFRKKKIKIDGIALIPCEKCKIKIPILEIENHQKNCRDYRPKHLGAGSNSGIKEESSNEAKIEEIDPIEVNYDIEKVGGGYYECPVCMCGFEQEEKLGVLQCFHGFHKSCIENWFKEKRECPVCKYEQ